MARPFGREGLTLCAVVGLLAAAGCANSNVITSAGAVIDFDGVPTPPDSTTSPTYVLARMQVAQVHVRPTDPTASAALGTPDINDPTRGIGLVQTSLPVDLKIPLGSPLGQVALAAGQYRGTQFQINGFELNMTTPTCSNDPTRTCLVNSDCVPPGVCPLTPAGAQCSGGLLSSLREDPRLTVRFPASSFFVVPAEGQILLQLRVDANKLVQTLESHCSGNTYITPTASELEAAGVFSLGE